MAPPLLFLDDISLTFGGDPLLNGASLSVEREERVALVGRNGSGKSTLLKIAAGMLEADRGTRFLQPGSTLRYLPQEPQFGTHQTVISYVEEGLSLTDDTYQARYVLEQLGLKGDENPAQLSGGEARRAALARALAPNPDILLLDEPTNHLDLPTIEWLESELANTKSALVLISHDRRFLQKLTRSTVWIDRGVTQQLKMGFEAFEPWRDAQFELEEQQRHKLDRKIAREEDWMRYGVTARRKRNVRRLADFHALKEQRRTARRATGKVEVSAAEADISGKLIIDAQNVSLSYEQRPIVKNFSTRIHRGDRIGIVGPNGAGKTTLLNILVGRLQPDAGTIQLGANIEMALLEQLRTQLNPTWTVAEALTGGQGDSVMVGGEPRHVMAYMQDFLFSPAQARTPLSVLSGGERARLMLARAFAKPSNFLVLDEPTNDLDIETLDVLEEMIGNYKGTVILISHDRDFIDRTVNAVIVAEGNGTWIEYAGGYSDMMAQRGEQRKAQAAVQKSVPKPQAPAPEKAPPRKLSFKDKHALETLPAAMAELEKKIAQLQSRLDDPSLYQRDRAAFDATSRDMTLAQSKLSEAEEKWLELECLREELEG